MGKRRNPSQEQKHNVDNSREARARTRALKRLTADLDMRDATLQLHAKQQDRLDAELAERNIEFQRQLTRQNEKLIKHERTLVKRWDAVKHLKASLAKREVRLERVLKAWHREKFEAHEAMYQEKVDSIEASFKCREVELDTERARLVSLKRQLDEKRLKLNRRERRTEKWAREVLGKESMIRDWGYEIDEWGTEGSESPPRGRRRSRS